jgi:subfamily B ATP-binding cassette protein MsbA
MAITPVVFGQIIKYIKVVNIVKLQQQSIYKLRMVFVDKLFSTKIYFLKSIKTGVLANSLSMEAQRVGLSIQYEINFYSYLFISLIYITILSFISKELLFFTIIAIPILPIIIKKQNSKLKNLGTVVAISNENIQNFIIEKVRLLKKLTLLNQQSSEKNKFDSIGRVFENAYLNSGKVTALVEAILEPLIFIVAMLIVYVGVIELQIGFDIIIVFVFVLLKLNQSTKGAIMAKNQISIYKGSYKIFKNHLDNLIKNQTKTNGIKKIDKVDSFIRLKNIDFAFDGTEVFNKLNLIIQANKTTALIGKSGSGKSTLIDMLLGFIDIENGQILYDENNIETLDLNALRKNIGFVTQDVYLFNGTVKDNLTYGLGEKSEVEIIEACSKAHILEFVESLEDGINTQIGEFGGKLSGGQKQRLHLAHLFLQDPNIIILDEPTSALDSESEGVILNSLIELHGKKTIILIAHRLSTIKHADKIIVLEDGGIVEEGTHKELINNGGRYSEYYTNGNK